jgi:hypothetical protein
VLENKKKGGGKTSLFSGLNIDKKPFLCYNMPSDFYVEVEYV